MQKTCSRCGGLLAPGATACSYCGQPVADAYPQQNYPVPTQYGAYPPTAATSDPYAAQYGTQAAPPPPPTGVSSGPSYGQPPYGVPVQTPPFGTGSQPPQFPVPPQPAPKKSSAPLIGVILAIIVVLAGLGVGGYFIFGNKSGGGGPQTNGTPTPSALYQSDLTKDPGGWVCNSTCSFRADGYHIEIPDDFVYSSYMTRQVFDNATLQVSGIIAKGDTKNSEIDLAFRIQQSSTLACYFFRIFSDGTYGVVKSNADGNFTKLIDDTPASALKKGLNQENTYKVVFNGPQYTLFINDQQVNQFTDTTYTKGYIGLGAGLKGTEGIFSNLTVTKAP